LRKNGRCRIDFSKISLIFTPEYSYYFITTYKMKKVVTFGEIMLRLSPPGFLRFTQSESYEATFGGGEANVAVSLANYGIATDFVSRIPKNDVADKCVMELRKFGVGTSQM
jgi:2-dehydro-3-deoxygluconokinase